MLFFDTVVKKKKFIVFFCFFLSHMRREISYLIIFLFLGFSLSNVVTRTLSGSWDDLNWTSGAVPNEKDDVVIPDGCLVSVHTAVTVRSFLATSLSQLTLNDNFIVSDLVPGLSRSFSSSGQVIFNNGAVLTSPFGSFIDRLYVANGGMQFSAYFNLSCHQTFYFF